MHAARSDLSLVTEESSSRQFGEQEICIITQVDDLGDHLFTSMVLVFANFHV